MKQFKTAVMGLGGFAQVHHGIIASSDRTILQAACDPQPERFDSLIRELKTQTPDLPVYTDYERLLDVHRGELDVVTVPTPIFLHAAMHEACVDNGAACYLEKPPTLDPAELASMIDVDERAEYQTQVAFHQLASPIRQQLKARLVQGEFGRLQRVAFAGSWPRGSQYFERNNWAGTLLNDDQLILDSCIGNAMSHYLNNCLFWAGEGAVQSWANVRSVEAEMYRAHPIESPDTVFSRALTRSGIPIHMAATHACSGSLWQTERVVCEQATVESRNFNDTTISWRDGRVERLTYAADQLHADCFESYLDYLQGLHDAPLMNLTQSKPFVDYHGLLYVASGHIQPVPSSAVRRSVQEESTFFEIHGIGEALRTFLIEGAFPSESGCDWGGAGGAATDQELGQLADVVKCMQAERAALS